MSILKNVKEALMQARVGKHDVAKSILSVIVGEVETLQFSKGQKGEITDQQIIKIINGAIASNEECMKQAKLHDIDTFKFEMENEILKEFLPKMWDKATIEEVLVKNESVLKEITETKNPGQAIGVAVKFLKSQNAPVNGADVAEVVRVLRDVA